ncbi:MAG: sugar phosphate nucleotidyltransferase [Candidatus Sericytochromatia bacterium]|nr:sugar phosphate nucleotidyltransferase [Candidatus Sericytochromatia bacterium]
MSNFPTVAVILAGGLGTRLRDTVPDLPKPMAPVAGRPFLEHLLLYWVRQGVRRFVLSVGYRHEVIESHFRDSYLGCSIVYVREPRPLGTGGGLMLCQRNLQLREPFILLNGDTFFKVALQDLHQQAQVQGGDWVISLFPTTDVRRYLPVTIAATGRVEFSNSAAHSKTSGLQLANGGVYWVHPRALDPFIRHEGYLSLEGEIFPRCQELGQHVVGLTSDATFIDIGVPADYARAQVLSCFEYARLD